MKQGVIVVVMLLLMVSAASALYVSPIIQKLSGMQKQPMLPCRTNLDCSTRAKAFTGTCPQGFVRDPQPICHGQLCSPCKYEQTRLRVVCRYDADCASQIKCSNSLNVQCAGNRCICSTQVHVECIRNHDCTRSLYLSQNYQRMECIKGKCITPKASSTLYPQYVVPKNVTMMPTY